jgi:leucyl-tRNA synthetase
MVYCQSCADKGLSYFTSEEAKKDKIGNWKLEIGNSDHEWAVGWFPVEDADLPVELPYIKEFKPLGTGESPLASDPEFVRATCPNCGSEARRETDVADTFLDSSWYFLRYPSTDFDTVPFDPEITKKWLPVDIYIGGAEHSVLHLLYSRFVGYVLHDLGKTSFDEPFPKFRAHGLIIKEGSKMSKSKGNVVNPDEYVEKFGADAIRLYLMFLGPFQQGGDFRDSGMEGMGKFVKRILRFANYQLEGTSDTFLTDEKLDILMNKTIKSVSQDIESLSYNTAIARIMEYVNALTKAGAQAHLDRKYLKTLVLLLAPFAPFITEHLYEKLDPEVKSVHLASWPQFDEAKTIDEIVTIAIQINGKLRDILSAGLDQSANESEITKMALSSEKIKAHINGKEVKKTIYVPGKVLNIVI